MRIENYSVGAEVNLDSRPITTFGNKKRGYVREQFHAQCIVVVQKPGAILSLSPQTITLPTVTIQSEQSIQEAAREILQDIIGFAGCLQLHGQFVPDREKPPIYLLRYLPAVTELDLMATKKGLVWVVKDDLMRLQSSFPSKLLLLMMCMKPQEELGYDQDGHLCIWTKEVKRRVTLSIKRKRQVLQQSAA